MVLHKSFLAYFAAERPVSRVNAQMKLKFSGRGKDFVAQVATKGFFPRVDPQMLGQIMIPVKRLAAELTAEGLVSRVQALVVLEVGWGGVALATLIAWKHGSLCKLEEVR